jgi:hypothetical protein
MADKKISRRAVRIIAAGETLAASPRWRTALSRATGISQSYLSASATGDGR